MSGVEGRGTRCGSRGTDEQRDGRFQQDNEEGAERRAAGRTEGTGAMDGPGIMLN